MFLADVTFTIPPLTILEISEIVGLISTGFVVAGWVLNLALSSKYIKKDECAAQHLTTDTGRAAALLRLAKVETDQQLTKAHLDQIEEHLRAIDALAVRQTSLEKAIALAEQPVKEFSDWMFDVKKMLQTFMEKTEERTMDHEKRLTAVETTVQIAERHRRRHQDDSGNPMGIK